MFHTFETTQYQSPGQAEATLTAAAKRRTSTVRACEPCRRRKIRCNGEHPCETCQWYRKAASCQYTEPRQRQVPSRRSVEKISQSLQEYRAILQKLFPNVHPEKLTGLSRDRLIDLISKTSPFQAPSPLSPGQEDRPPSIHPDAGSLEQLQLPPDDTDDDGGSAQKPRNLSGISDDVNALSLSMKNSSSYLGISSVMAALRVIVWLDPDCQAFVNKSPERSHFASREASLPPEPISATPHPTPGTDRSSIAPWEETPRIDAYFQYVHPFIPLVDEHSFRESYMARSRNDAPWQLLQNVILAMGSVAHGNVEDTSHRLYFARAKEHLNLETLASAHVETVQALAILSGFYLHYLQEPNLANAMMGATLRMATMLGLHRDFSEGVGPGNSHRAAFPIEMRRRIWWSIFMLDTWASNTLGRPSMGRASHAITADLPQEPIGDSVTMMALMQENTRFCIISTRMEDSLAYSPLMDESERQSLDAAFVEWFHASSVQSMTIHHTTTEMPGITVLKNVMRWRYLFSRAILHRPALLWYAMRKMPFRQLSEDKKAAVEVCRDVTEDLITDIASTWHAQKPCQMSGWNATWLLYQAAMVPLLTLFSDRLDSEVVDRSRQQIEITISTLSQLKRWSSTAKRSLDVVSRIYAASRRHTDSSHQTGFHTPAPLASTPVMQHRPNYIDLPFASTPAMSNAGPFLTPSRQELYMDNMFDSLNWSTGWNNNDYPFETPSLGWDYNAMNGWGNNMDFDGYFNSVFSGTTADEPLQMSHNMGFVPSQQNIPVSHYSYP